MYERGFWMVNLTLREERARVAMSYWKLEEAHPMGIIFKASASWEISQCYFWLCTSFNDYFITRGVNVAARSALSQCFHKIYSSHMLIQLDPHQPQFIHSPLSDPRCFPSLQHEARHLLLCNLTLSLPSQDLWMSFHCFRPSCYLLSFSSRQHDSFAKCVCIACITSYQNWFMPEFRPTLLHMQKSPTKFFRRIQWSR